ncbi:MAG: hypothetical protein DI570_00070 [Phenylobacterium zucineum]|nr:MAG: hypothetical protein DI570_00070 [Phenylobacterium zucineum]
MSAAAILFWIVALAAATAFVRFERRWPAYELQQLPFDACVVLLGASHAVLQRVALERSMRLAAFGQTMVMVLATLAVSLPFEWVMRAMGRAFFPEVGNLENPPFTVRVITQALVFWGAIFGLWAAANLALMYAAEARRRERRLLAAQAQAREAQILALRYQVNPHFLFNTLNTVSALILEGRNQDADEMVLRLSGFFHATLEQDPLHDTPLREEIELQRLYLEIERVRFEDQLTIEVDLPEELEEVLAPSLILQPLVENAVKHGLRGPDRMMRLRIAARTDGARLMLEVSDDGRGVGSDRTGHGVGLRNVEARLATRFPDDHGFEAGPGPAGGFSVRLGFPLRRP